LKAQYHMWKLTQEGHGKAIRYCEEAIALDPQYAVAYARMAECYYSSVFQGYLNPREALPKVRAAAIKALEIDDALAEAHGSLGYLLGTCDFDWRSAESEFRRALELNPSLAYGRWTYVFFLLLPTGRLAEAMIETRRILEQDPLSPIFNVTLGYLFYLKREYDQALIQMHHAIELDPSYFTSYWMLSLICLTKGQIEEAAAAAEKACELSGHNARSLAMLGMCWSVAGRTAEARRILEQLKTRSITNYVPASAMALIYSCLGEFDLVLEWYSKAIEERDLTIICTLKTDPAFDPFRTHPRFHVLLQKMNLL
jgi:tetratricopeptide (TPR) repeat protein